MSRNDHNKILLESHQLIPLLQLLINEGNIEEKYEAVSALWTLSFDKNIANTMIETDGVVELLDELLKTAENDELKDLAHRTLWTMREYLAESEQYRELGKKLMETADDTENTSDERGHIMISYNRYHRDIAKQICDELQRKRYNVWIDVNDMHGSTLDSMAEAIEKADMVLVCYSPQYKDSNNCKLEAGYAHEREKTTFYLKMVSEYKPDGWLGILLGNKLFYDFGGKYPFKKKFQELEKAIEKEYKSMKKKK